jgi:phage FluMu protein Com
MGTYYEARCGNCDAVLYRTTRGVWVREVKCPQCKADNIFGDSTAQPDGDIQGQVVDASHGIGRTSRDASVSGQ